MRYTYIFEDGINRETVQGIIDGIHGHEEVDLYISTPGGETFPTYILIDYLNKRKDSVDLYFTNECCSAGTILLTDFKGKKYITNSLEIILFHKFDCMEYQLRKGQVNQKELKKQLVENNIEYREKLVKLGLTEKELKVFDRGEDLMLYRKDFNRLKI